MFEQQVCFEIICIGLEYLIPYKCVQLKKCKYNISKFLISELKLSSDVAQSTGVVEYIDCLSANLMLRLKLGLVFGNFLCPKGPP